MPQKVCLTLVIVILTDSESDPKPRAERAQNELEMCWTWSELDVLCLSSDAYLLDTILMWLLANYLCVHFRADNYRLSLI